MVVERKGVSRLGSKEPARASASPFRPTIKKKGGRQGSQKTTEIAFCPDLRSAKTDWQCRPARES